MDDFCLNKDTLAKFWELCCDLSKTNKRYRVSIKEWSDKRKLPANAVQHVWYKQIADKLGHDAREAGNMCKLDFGVPIILSDDKLGSKLGFILNKIGFHQMTREQQIGVMDFIQITSIMSTSQHKQYREDIQVYYNNNGLNLEYR